jgi:hypothetical protein
MNKVFASLTFHVFSTMVTNKGGAKEGDGYALKESTFSALTSGTSFQ